MDQRRSIIYGAVLLAMTGVPGGLWLYLNGVRNNMVSLTGFLVRQVHQGNEDSQARFYTRYRFPEGDHEPEEFIQLWYALYDVDPSEVVYGDQEPLECVDGKTRRHKQVIIRGEDLKGSDLTVELEWVRYRGSWYIHSYNAYRT